MTNKAIGMFGLSLDEVRRIAESSHDGLLRYYTPDEVVELLRDEVTSYLVRKYDPAWKHSDVSTYIVLDGELTFVGKTDLHGQVGTSISATSDNAFYRNPIKSYRDMAIYGAVLKKRNINQDDRPHSQSLMVIDALTDG